MLTAAAANRMYVTCDTLSERLTAGKLNLRPGRRASASFNVYDDNLTVGRNQYQHDRIPS